MTELSIPESPASAASQGTIIEQSRAVAEVAAAVRVAQDNPRDVTRAVESMRLACQHRALADRAFYSLPRAGGRVEGSTVHLARELARCWGNLDYGIRELARDEAAHQSEMQAWAWDQETNTRSTRSFIVPHERMAKKQRQPLLDLGDISNNNNSVAARALRETIFTVLPVWFRTEAEEIATQALHGGGGKTPDQQKADAIAHFRDSLNVTPEQLSERIGRPVAAWTAQDVAGLRVLASEIARGEKNVAEEFEQATLTAADLAVDATTSQEAQG